MEVAGDKLLNGFPIENFPKLYLFIGSHGTGKTEVCKRIEPCFFTPGCYNFANTVFIDGIPRTLRKEYNFEKTSEDKQLVILFNYLGTLHTYMYSHDENVNIIATNNAVRFLGYANANNLSLSVLNLLNAYARIECSLASKIFYFPIEVPLIDDGIRPSDRDYQTTVDLHILDWLKKNDISFLTVSGDIETKLNVIKSFINIR